MKHKKQALFKSIISLMLCLSMLVGTTFAWFTDSVTTGINQIAAGNLDVELYHSNAAVTGEKVDASTKLFLDLQGDPILWEPGVVSYENLRITNEGDLALVYQLAMATENENFVIDGSEKHGLSEVLKVGFVENGITATDRKGVVDSVDAANWTTLAQFVREGKLLPEGKGESEKTWGIVIYWEPGENDDLWNLNNGKQLSEGETLSIDLGVKLIATQAEHESDSFGSDYDATAKTDVFPVFVPSESVSVTVTPGEDGRTTDVITMQGGQITATVPAGVLLAEGATELTLTVTEKTATDSDVVLGENEALRPLDVHIEGISAENTVPIIVDLGEVMPTGLNMGNYQLYHVENGTTNTMTLVETPANHNEYSYNPATGRVVVAMATFSELTLVADAVAKWEGSVDHSWYDADSAQLYIANADQLWSFSQIVGGMASGIDQDTFSGKTICLTNDINLADKNDASEHLFYPIGYYNEAKSYDKPTDGTATAASVSSFEGVFDGTGHTISNFYQNTWQMWGDYDGNNYKTAMGLFGYVYNGTVKNLTVDHFSSDGEFTPTGVIAAYADGNVLFENIAITNCNPRVYNTGNGGIIGIAGDTSAANDDHITLTNITVDNSNKISALWGSWDVACGGLVGMYRGNVDSNGAATGDTISFTNCHVAAQIDVNNDVCANYQYYAYRYAGMIIGSIRHNTADANGNSIPNMTGITATGCTVNFGTWNDYWYCELVDNSKASYTHDYQFSRLEEVASESEMVTTGTHHYILITRDENGAITNTPTCYHYIDGAKHEHSASGTETVDGKTVDVEDKVCINLPFDQLFTGYGWGVNSQSIDELDGITIKVTESEQKESVPKFDVALENADSFLYRVGNGNTVEIGKLFKALDGVTVNGSSVVVSVSPRDPANLSVTGTYKVVNTDDWTKNTIQFSGTGVVTLTIQDYQYCTPTVLEVEVVSGNNITADEISSLGSGNAVLLNNVKLVEGGALSLSGATLFGNGFEMDVTAGRNVSPEGKVSNNYLLNLASSVLDNVRIVGAVYTTYGGSAADPYNNPVVLSSGNSVILNSYISNCASPVRVKDGNLEIVNTTLKGGNYSNLDIRGGHVILDNVTTINQVNGNDTAADGTVVVGLGVAVYNENVPATTTIEVKNGITQYNFISKAQADTYLKDTNAKTLMGVVFENNDLSTLRYTDSNGVLWVNTGILSMTESVGDANITDVEGYLHGTATLSGTEGYVHTKVPTAADVVANAPDTESGEQGSIAPTAKFDFETKNYVANDGSNDYCYEDGGTVYISMDEGDTFNWDTSILTVTKNGQTLDYTVSMEGTDYTGKSIAFNTAGDYTVTYTYTDPNNYGVDAEGNVGTYPKSYEKKLHISVAVIEANMKHAEFTFGSNTATEKIIVDDVTYISATGVTADNTTWTYMTIGGQKIYYPIVAATLSTTKGTSAYAYFPVFENVVSITDYVDGNAENKYTYNSKTTAAETGKTALPIPVKGVYGYQKDLTSWTNLKDEGNNLGQIGASKIFKWFASTDAPSDPVTYNTNNGNGAVLCYQSTNSSSNSRDAGYTLVKYSYTDATNTTYYYYVGYTTEAFTYQGVCVTADTLVTLASGEQKRIEDMIGEEMLLVWNHTTGMLDSVPAVNLVKHSDVPQEYEIIHLYFSNGRDIKIIGEHVFFDNTLNLYVPLDNNAAEYIGHEFAMLDGEHLSTAKLMRVEKEIETTIAYEINSYQHLTSFTNGILSASAYADKLLNIFDIDPNTMAYNEEKIAEDIQTYGLYTYADFAELIDEETFELYNAQFLKIAVGKGYITWEDILELIDIFLSVEDDII